MKCFAECPTESILDAIGITFEELFPERLGDHLPRLRPAFPPGDVLKALMKEVMIVAVASAQSARGELSMADRERLMVASVRISNATSV
jgi:hypothetical protein